MTMLPKPMYKGASPELRKSARSSGGVKGGSARKKKPQISVRGGQRIEIAAKLRCLTNIRTPVVRFSNKGR